MQKRTTTTATAVTTMTVTTTSRLKQEAKDTVLFICISTTSNNNNSGRTAHTVIHTHTHTHTRFGIVILPSRSSHIRIDVSTHVLSRLYFLSSAYTHDLQYKFHAPIQHTRIGRTRFLFSLYLSPSVCVCVM